VTHRFQLALLHSAHFACHYFLLIFPTAAIAIERDWRLGYGEALALGTPVYACLALGTLPAGWLGDRYDGDYLIALFFVGCGTASVLVALAPDDVYLMAGLGALGFFASIYHPVGLAMVTRSSARPGRALAANGVFGNLGLAGASLSSGLLADAFGWRSAFLVPGIVAIGIGAVHFLVRSQLPAKDTTLSSGLDAPDIVPLRAVEVRVVGVVLLAALFSGIVFNGVSVSLPKLFEERLGGAARGLSEIGRYGAMVFAVAAFAQLPVGALLDRVGGRPILLGLFALEAGALIVTSRVGGVLVVPSTLVTVTLMFAGIPITGWLLGRHVASSRRSRAFAAEYVLSLGMGAMVIPAMAGLHEAGYGFDWQYLLFALSAGAVACGALCIPKHGSSDRMTSPTGRG